MLMGLCAERESARARAAAPYQLVHKPLAIGELHPVPHLHNRTAFPTAALKDFDVGPSPRVPCSHILWFVVHLRRQLLNSMASTPHPLHINSLSPPPPPRPRHPHLHLQQHPSLPSLPLLLPAREAKKGRHTKKNKRVRREPAETFRPERDPLQEEKRPTKETKET